MNGQPAVLARHDCERLPDSAWLAQLKTEIRTRDAQEGLLLPLAVEDLATAAGEMGAAPSDAAVGIAWLTAIAARTMAASEAGEESPLADDTAIPGDAEDARDGTLRPQEARDGTLRPQEAPDDEPALSLNEHETAEESAQPQLQRARQHARDGDLSAALATYASLLPAGPGLAPCAEDLAALAQVQPRNAAIHQLLGDVQRALGHLEVACVSYQRALTLLSNEEA